MEEIIKLLGEDNKKRLQDGITDLLLRQVESDLEDKYQYDYILAFDEIFEEVKGEIKDIVKEKMMKKCLEEADRELKRIFG